MDTDKNALPELDRFEVEQLVDDYKKVYQPVTSLTSAYIRKSPNKSSVLIISNWCQRNLERGTVTKIQRTILCNKSLKECTTVNTVDISNWTLNVVSKSGKFKAVLLTVPETKLSTKGRNYLEIWSQEKSILTFDLAGLDQHGIVYTDEVFGSLSWNPDEDKVLYIAEKTPRKTVPFYQQKPKSEQEDKIRPILGAQYVYDDDWGEQMASKRQPVIAICDIKEKIIRILDGIPVDVCPGQVTWDPNGNGVIGVAHYHKPRRLGIVYCTNRTCGIFHLSLNRTYTILSDESKSVVSPRFSPNGKYLIWLQRDNTGPHFTVSELVKYNWRTKEKNILVGTVEDSVLTRNGKEFHGIFCEELPDRCWSADSKYIFFSSMQKYRFNSYMVDVDDGTVWDIGSNCPYESTSILDVAENNYVAANRTSFIQPAALVSLNLSTIFSSGNIKPNWYCVTESMKHEKNIIDQFTVYDIKTKEERCFATYYGPRNDQKKSTSLILYPHGGPHSSVPSAFKPSFHLYSRLGYGILIVYYRGTIGCGKRFVDCLPGNVGTLDVEDCYMALQNALEKYPWLDKDRVLLLGSSHGGFLVTHLSSQYPNDFICTVAVNPVTNIPAMLYGTDIPDWTLVESGYPYNGMVDVINNPEIWRKMADVSPIKYIKKVKTPTLLLLGKKDLRVPTSQGLSYYNMLKELKVHTKAYLYDDNHSLGGILVEMDSIINTIIWFRRCLRRAKSN